MKTNFTIKEVNNCDPQAIKALLEQSYWAKDRTLDTIEHSIQNSLCFGVFESEKLIGFGRAVTDYATMYWLCDIIIDEKYRGQGLGKLLVSKITNHEAILGLRGILATADAHELYTQFGFEREPEKYMSKKRTRL